MTPPIQTDLLKHLPDTHRPLTAHEHAAMRQHRAARREAARAFLAAILAARGPRVGKPGRPNMLIPAATGSSR